MAKAVACCVWLLHARAAAQQPPTECGTGPQFMARSQAVTEACCGGASTCVSGMPTACTKSCAEFLLPMRIDCAGRGDFTAGPAAMGGGAAPPWGRPPP